MPFIRESIVTTRNADGSAYIAPLGVIVEAPFLVIAPFRPSTTLDNLRRHPFACVSYTTDTRIFAGCVSRRQRSWPVLPAGLPGLDQEALLMQSGTLGVLALLDDPATQRRIGEA